MRSGRAWFAAPVLAVVLLLAAGGSVSVAAEGDPPMVVSADQSGSLGVVSTAQSDGGTDPESDGEQRLVGRESSERVDAVVIALWSIAVGMTVMLAVFLWHTSPRRRLRLARRRSTALYDAEVEGSEDGSVDEGPVERPAGDGSAEEGSAEEGSAEEGSAEEGSAEEGPAEDVTVVEEATEPAEDEPRGSVRSRLLAWLRDLT